MTIIALPLVIGLTMSAVAAVDPALRQQVFALGATRWQITWSVLRESRVGVTAAVVAAFGANLLLLRLQGKTRS
jgi:tungstate transport system permease protein